MGRKYKTHKAQHQLNSLKGLGSFLRALILKSTTKGDVDTIV